MRMPDGAAERQANLSVNLYNYRGENSVFRLKSEPFRPHFNGADSSLGSKGFELSPSELTAVAGLNYAPISVTTERL